MTWEWVAFSAIAGVFVTTTSVAVAGVVMSSIERMKSKRSRSDDGTVFRG